MCFLFEPAVNQESTHFFRNDNRLGISSWGRREGLNDFRLKGRNLAASGTSAVCCMYPLRVAISPKVSISICPTPGIFVWLCGGMENQGSRYEDSSFRLGPFVFSLALSVGLFPGLVNGPKDPKPVIRFPATPARNRRRVSKGESRELNNSSRQQYHRIFRSSVRETVSLAK